MKHYKPSGGKAKKRLLALVLAMTLIVGCLLPVYANGVATMDAGFGVATMDDGFSVDAQAEDDGLDLAPGITEKRDADGNIVYVYDEDTFIDWTGDDAIVSPYPDGEQMDPGFAIPTNTYRFWLTNDKTKREAADVEIASAMKLYDMTAYDATEMYGPLYGMYTLVAIADGGTMSDNTVLNPTTANAPDASKPYFAGWYTVDEFGYEQEFLFDHSTVSVAKSATVDVFAKWTAAKSGEAAQPNEDLAAEQTYERWFAQLISCSDSAFNDLIDRYLEDEGFEAWLNNLPADELQHLSDRMDSFVETLDTQTESHSKYIRQGTTGTVSFTTTSGGQTVSQNRYISDTVSYAPTTSGITVAKKVSSSNNSAYSGYTITVASYVPTGDYTLKVTYKYKTSDKAYATSYDVTDTVTLHVMDADFTITNNMVDTEVAYIDFKPSSSTNYTLTPLTDGQTVKGTGSKDEGVLVFFIKPKDGYLLTKFVNAEGTACDLYSVTVEAESSMIEYFRKHPTQAQKVLDAAKEQGYLGYYGFTYSGSAYPKATYSTKAERPQMTVTAEANPSTGVKPGDTVTYTVTITPGHTSTTVDEDTGVTINSLKVNGQDETYSTPTKNADGTYTTTVTHTVTDADWEAGDVKLVVEASVDYSYKITVNDRKDHYSDIPTEATVPNTAEVSVQVAPKNGVKYHVTYEPADLTPPPIIKTVPYDTNEYFEGNTVTVNSTYGTATPATGEPANKVDDPTNGGTWTFNGWYKDESLTQKASTTETMVDGGLHFYGKWTFEEYPNTSVTITKKVTGFFGERDKDFEFTVSIVDKENKPVTEGITATKDEADLPAGQTWSSFTLQNGESVVLSGVPIGATITVKETDAEGYEVSAKVGNTQLTNSGTDSFSYTVEKDAVSNQIKVTNHSTKQLIDQGIDLGSATPYLFLLCVGAVGVATLKRKRRD